MAPPHRLDIPVGPEPGTSPASSRGSGRPRERRVIGRREVVRLPEWGVRLRAKVDTGARTSALDVDELHRVGDDRIRFRIVLGRDRSRWREVEARVARVARVRPSSGTAQVRYFVETLMELGGVEKRVEVSLVPRRGMQCRMLLGRSALHGEFLINPDVSYRLGRLRPKERKTP